MKTVSFILLIQIFFLSCSSKKDPVENSNKTSAEEVAPEKSVANSETDQPLIAKDPETTDNSPHVVMDTSMGEIIIELDALNAPITVKNFLNYVASKHYDKTIFHRVIDGFMIQGGGFSSEGDEKATDEPIKNEGKNGLSNKRGTIAMARTCLLYTSPSLRDQRGSRMPSSA